MNVTAAPATATRFLAHSRNDNGAGVAESVRDHVQRVTELAVEFAAAFGMQQQAEVAGLLHDLGKYSDQFQRRLTIRHEPSRDHWSIGAWFALSCYKSVGLYPALVIRGHHVGLDELRSTKELYRRLEKDLNEDCAGTHFTTNNLQDVWKHFQADNFKLPKVDQYFKPSDDDSRPSAEMLDVRMLFSALVDADY